MAIITILAGATTQNLRLNSGDAAYVDGTAISTHINSGGAEYVNAGGFAYGVTVSAGGAETVSGRATDDFSSILSGGAEYVSGGTALGAAVQSGGALYVTAGGAVDAALRSGGVDFVGAGGTATATQIGSGAVETISGGTAYSAVVASGANQTVQAGGTASFTQVQAGGVALVASGGAVFSAVVSSGGMVEIFGQGTATGTHILSGGTELVSSGGVADGGVLSSGGAAVLLRGAGASGVSVRAGGILVAMPGASLAAVTGAVTSTGVVLVQPGAATLAAPITQGAIVGQNGTAYVLSGGLAVATSVDGGFSFATISVTAGGETDSTSISSGGQEFVAAGAVASGSVANSAGYQYVSGGVAYGTVLAADGTLYVVGGSAVRAVVEAGARVFVESGGGAVAASVASGADLLVVSGGSVYQAVVAGAAYVDSTGVASDTTIAGGILVFSAGAQALGGIVFSGGTLVIDSTEAPAAVISGFGAGDMISLGGLSGTVSLAVPQAGELAVTAGGVTEVLNIAEAVDAAAFGVTGGNGVVLTDNAPCFAAGTHILTSRGDVAVAGLAVGDAVITLAGEEEAIIWIGRRFIDLTRHAHPALAQPVRLGAGCLGDGAPARDLLLSPDHAIYHAGVLIPAKALLNGGSITQLPLARVVYYHIELARHAVVFAEGLPVETYLDTGNRHGFDDGGVATTLHPDFAQTRREQQSCAPFVEAGPVVAALREKARISFCEQKEAKKL